MNRRIIQNDKGLFCDSVAEVVKAGCHNVCINPAFKNKRCAVIIFVHKCENVKPLTSYRGDFDIFTFWLPCIGNTGNKTKTGFIKKIG